MKRPAWVVALLVALVLLALPGIAQADMRLATLKVKGMVCQFWPISIATALERLPGVKRAEVRLETEEARVVYDDAKQTPAKLAAAIDLLGFRATVASVGAAPRPTLLVEGLVNPPAIRKVEQALKAVNGVRAVVVDTKHGEVFVEYDSRSVLPQQLLAAVKAAGFAATLPGVP